jgi:hypothetical protein
MLILMLRLYNLTAWVFFRGKNLLCFLWHRFFHLREKLLFSCEIEIPIPNSISDFWILPEHFLGNLWWNETFEQIMGWDLDRR